MEKTRRSALKASMFAIAVGTFMASPATAQPSSPANLADTVAAARTRADHEQIAAEFDKLAGRHRADAARHRKMAALYKTPAWSKMDGAGMVKHCESLTRAYESAAKTHAEMARMHRDIGAKLP